ncbi:MAG: hypothetical protein AB7R69_05645, partial [Candidatus Babeliales bacterium]
MTRFIIICIVLSVLWCQAADNNMLDTDLTEWLKKHKDEETVLKELVERKRTLTARLSQAEKQRMSQQMMENEELLRRYELVEGALKRDSLEHKNGQAHYKENDLDFNELFVEPLKQAIAHDPSVIQ